MGSAGMGATSTLGPALVVPLHDANGSSSAHLRAVTPALKALFAGAWIGLTPTTRAAVPDYVSALEADPFFRVCSTPAAGVGVQFSTLYRAAAAGSPPDQMLHLCFLDRLAYAVTEHHATFAADIAAAGEPLPLLFQRSEAAWATHPRPYREIEGMITRTGALLFGQTLDFAWCHLAVRAGDLAALLPGTGAEDMSLLAEILIALRQHVITRDVDWLAWEDPFFLGRPADELRAERETGTEDIRKRLSYAIPMLARLYEASQKHPSG